MPLKSNVRRRNPRPWSRLLTKSRAPCTSIAGRWPTSERLRQVSTFCGLRRPPVPLRWRSAHPRQGSTGKSLKSLPLSHRLICRPRNANSWQSSASSPTREPHTERPMKANTTPALSRTTEVADPVSVSQALPSHGHPPPNPSFKRTRLRRSA